MLTMAAALPLATLLSHALVAFTIEFDNEAERCIPHRTTRYGQTERKPGTLWLVSMAMYLNCMQFLDGEGMSARDLVRRARARTNFRGMHRWGYITTKPEGTPERPKPPKAEWIVRPTAAGRTAQQLWKPLIGEIEDRWDERFGSDEVKRLRASLATIESQLKLNLPDCMPILGYGFFPNRRKYADKAPISGSTEEKLPVLLARVLLAFALDFESEFELSLAISANALRALAGELLPVRDLPRATGMSQEAASMSLKFLVIHGYAVLEADPAGLRTKVARLTDKGLKTEDAYRKRLRIVEKQWRQRFGTAVDDLRRCLEPLVGEGTAATSQLFRGLEPPLNGWRAKVRGPETLPHFPLVLHRGGYPDGS
jgi:DNA-binding MarR family transcriptional regulator